MGVPSPAAAPGPTTASVTVGAPQLQPAASPLVDSVSLPTTPSLAEHEMAALYQDAPELPSSSSHSESSALMVGAPPLQPAALPLADSVSLPMTLSLAEHEMAALYQDASESPSLWVAPPSESLASDSELWTAPSSPAAALLVDAVTQTVTLTPSCALVALSPRRRWPWISPRVPRHLVDLALAGECTDHALTLTICVTLPLCPEFYSGRWVVLGFPFWVSLGFFGLFVPLVLALRCSSLVNKLERR
mmetsp:Transcript_71931/g.169304  ORF Transcript_71931/g.169304 Transcript_71931/m.169304 type:complete len:247 (-) Transcript_71931:82-822(-)